MFVGLLTLRILLHDAHSLKEKRHVVHSLLDRIRARWNVSDAQIAIVLVSNDGVAALRALNHIRDFAAGDVRFDVAQVSCEWR